MSGSSEGHPNRKKLERLLPRVIEPGQYVGGEPNAIVKADAGFRVALCFPDTYGIGMSHLGLRILYDLANDMPGVACERAYTPLPDMEAELRRAGLPLGTVETWTPLCEFDLIGFSLPYELGAANILTMLDLGGVPLRRVEHREGDPFVLGGGHLAFNPEPLTDFFDLFLIGEGEEALPQIIEIMRAAGGRRCRSRAEILARLAAEVTGLYIPALYETATDPAGFLHVSGPIDNAPYPVKRRVVSDFENAPVPARPLVPIHQTVHERVSLEIMRGCPHGCRFCQAGFITRPARWRSVDTLVKMAATAAAATGFDEVALLSLSTSDYPHFDELVQRLDELLAPQNISLSLPSLRVSQLLRTVPPRLKTVRKSGLTLAPEAATARLRRVINKDVADDDLLAAAAAAYEHGWQHLKLYFMIGLPTETDDDVAAIAALVNRVARLRRKRSRKKAVTAAIGNFVPKAHTPFQWEAMDTPEELARKQKLLARHIDRRRVNLKTHDPLVSHLEGILARGDRRLGRVIHRAWELGARLDGWTEHFDMSIWEQAFAEKGLNGVKYACERREPQSPLPWSHIDTEVRTEFLASEAAKAKAAETTPSCAPGVCAACGIEKCPLLVLAESATAASLPAGE